MEIQNFILEHYEILLLFVGSLFLFLGLAPILSDSYYYKNIHQKKRSFLFSEKEGYIYNRYLRQLEPILIGVCLVLFSIYKLL